MQIDKIGPFQDKASRESAAGHLNSKRHSVDCNWLWRNRLRPAARALQHRGRQPDGGSSAPGPLSDHALSLSLHRRKTARRRQAFHRLGAEQGGAEAGEGGGLCAVVRGAVKTNLINQSRELRCHESGDAFCGLSR